MTGALESFADPLIDPILALLKDGVNADMATALAALATPPEDTRAAILSTARRPFVMEMDGAGVLPALHCYRIRTRSQQITFVHRDQFETLQFVYVTPEVSADLVSARWAVLNLVWQNTLATLKRGRHPAHQANAEVLGAAGVMRIDLATARKTELFIENHFPFPGFVAELEFQFRGDTTVPFPLHPALSVDSRFYINRHGATSGRPDVVARTIVGTPYVVDDFGNVVVDADGEPIRPSITDADRFFDLPYDWTLGIGP